MMFCAGNTKTTLENNERSFLGMGESIFLITGIIKKCWSVEVMVKIRAAITQVYSFIKILCDQCSPFLTTPREDHSHYPILGGHSSTPGFVRSNQVIKI